MNDLTSYVPLSAVIPEGLWPADLLNSGDGGVLDRIAYEDGEVVGTENEWGLWARLQVIDEVAFPMPILGDTALVLGGGSIEATIQGSGLSWTAELSAEVLKLRFPRALLKPVKEEQGKFVPDPDEAHFVEVTLPLHLIVHSTGEIEIEWPGGTASPLTLPKAMIGDSGVIIEVNYFAFRLNGLEPIPADYAPLGLPDSWRGLLIQRAAVTLPPDLTVALPDVLAFEHCAIGSGGFSGTVSTNWSLPLSGQLLGATFALRGVEIGFAQNTPTAFRVSGDITLPFFDQPVNVELGVDVNGDFMIRLSASGGIYPLTKPGVLDLQLESIAFAREGGGFTVTLSGQLTPLVGGLSWPGVRVQALSIDSAGHVRIDGGWLNLPSQLALDFHGFRMELTKIGFGTDEDGTRWIGFSGGVRLVGDLPMGGSVEGLKIKWKGSDVNLELRGIGVQMLLPGTLAIDGKVEFVEEGTISGFKGGVKLRLIPTNVTVDAQLLVGRNSQSPAYTFAYVFVAGDLPAGIPLLSTGLSLYGIAGLVGYNVAPDKQALEPWFEDPGPPPLPGWYLRSPVGVSDVGKWRDEREALAFGAGVTIGTASDNGYAYHGSFLLVLLLPGPVILIDGKSAFLTKRGGEPQLLTFAVFDGRAGTLLFNVQARYRYPGGGELVDMTAFAEAFFDFGSPRKWHLYLGMDAPKEKRVRAALLALFEANGYLMLTHDGVRLGAWYGYAERWKVGPLGITLEAWVEGAAAVSWAPTQLDGNLTLHGDVGLRAFGISLGLFIQALVGVRAPHPYYFHAKFKVKLRTPWPLPDPKATIELTLEEDVPPPTPKPLEILGLEHLKVSEKWVMASSMGAAPVVPLDVRPVVSFQRSVWDHTGLASNALPPAPERVGGYLFRYHLDAIRLEKRATGGGGWVDVTTPASPSLPAGVLWSMWQAVPSSIGDGSPQGLPPMTKLMLWSRTPFDYGRESEGTATEDGFVDANPDWPCDYEWTPVRQCGDFEGRSLGPMPPFSSLGSLVIVALGAQIVEWSEDWIPVTRAVSIGARAQPDAKSGGETGTGGTTIVAATTALTAGGFVEAQVPPGHWRSMLRIFFPPNTAAAYLYLGRGTKGWLVRPGKQPQELKYVKEPVLVDAGSENLTYVDLMGTVHLLRVCWVERGEWDRVRFGVASVGKLGTDAPKALTAEAAILEPHKKYRLTVETRVERSGNGGQSWDTVGRFVDEGYFTTRSAPGLEGGAAGSDLEPTTTSEHYPARGPLQDLTLYVHATIPTDGVRPVYRSYDIGVEFNESYTEAMYLLEGKPLVLQVQDANGQPILDASGNPLTTLNQWRMLEAAQILEIARPAETAWIGLLQSTGCADLAGAELPPPQGLWLRHPRLLLAAQAVHRAVVGSALPSAAVPLAVDGTILMDSAGSPVVVALMGSVSDQLDLVNTAGTGQKLLVAGGVVAETSLGATGGAQAFDGRRFDQVALLGQALAEAGPPPGVVRRVYDWSFTTSRFATFVHHVHSYRDLVRDLHEELGAPAQDLFSAEELAWLEALLAARSTGIPSSPTETERDEEAQAFEKVMSLLGLETRPLPEVLEVTLLRDATASYGLLLESPEPLPSDRVSFAIRRQASPIESMLEPEESAKLVGAGFAPSDTAADLVAEFLELVLYASMKLEGLKVQIQDAGGMWQDYFTFGPTEILPEGTVVRVHTGASAEDANPVPEMEHYYAQDTGGPSQRRFVASSVRARLVAPNGRAMHERLFLSSGFASVRFRILRSRDDTRALIFLESRGDAVGGIPVGTLRLSWTFRRNISPHVPILRRMGSDRSETTAIEFPIAQA